MCVATRMHADEVAVDVGLVRRLLAEQHPRWADLPVSQVRSWGTDHALYRLGDDLVARMPRIGWAAGQAALEAAWLPALAPHLPLRVPEVRGLGEPGHGYPYAWSVQTWLIGTDVRTALDDDLLDRQRLAHDLAGLVAALLSAPVPQDAPTSVRGQPLADTDEAVRTTLPRIADLVDTASTLRLWQAALEVPAPEPTTWVHGDLLPGNLIAAQGRLAGVIDWGSTGLGDPAVELLPAWHVLGADERPTFRAALPAELRSEAAWARGRGWVVLQAVMALAYYRETNPTMMRQAGLALTSALAEDPA